MKNAIGQANSSRHSSQRMAQIRPGHRFPLPLPSPLAIVCHFCDDVRPAKKWNKNEDRVADATVVSISNMSTFH